MKWGFKVIVLLVSINVTSAIDVNASCNQIKQLWDTGSCCGSADMMLTYPNTGHPGAVTIASEPVQPLKSDLNITILSQADFVYGTVRLTTAGVYKLSENIVFDPNIASDNWPVCTGSGAQVKYCSNNRPIGGYNLGFFAAIAMEADNVHLDLNGKTLSMSPSFALQQRFFALIELADAPFIPDAGPGADANSNPDVSNGSIAFCTRCSITNGHLGLSSHHAIHGNHASDILIKDVTMKDYEIAGISLNSVSRVKMENIDVQGHNIDIPSRATYSASRYLNKFWTEIKTFAIGAIHGGMDSIAPGLSDKAKAFLPAATCSSMGVMDCTGPSVAYAEMESRNIALRVQMDAFYATVITGSADAEGAQTAFGNFVVNDAGVSKRLVDGNAYGITLHGKGPLVGRFAQTINVDETDMSTDIILKNVKISGVLANVNEVLQLRGTDGKAMLDVAGSTIRLSEIYDFATGIMTPDRLHKMRFALAYHATNDPLLAAAAAFRALGTLRIGAAFSGTSTDTLPNAWAASPDTPFQFPINNSQDVMCNFDSMHHKQKGVVALFLQQSKRVSIINLEINNVANFGKKGSSACGAYSATPHDATADDHLGYTGTQAYGILINTARDYDLKSTTINHVSSAHGDSRALFINNDVERVGIQDFFASGLVVGDGGEDSPNNVKRSNYIELGDRVKDIKLVGHLQTLQ